MAQLPINLGTYANDGTGDDLRTAFTKVNANFLDLYTNFGQLNAANLGPGTGLFLIDTNNVLQFKSLTSTSNSVTITNTANTVNLESVITVQRDTAPVLGGNLTLNGHNIIGSGDFQSTVWGIDVRTLNTQVQTALATSFGDQGTFTNPTLNVFDLGTF